MAPSKQRSGKPVPGSTRAARPTGGPRRGFVIGVAFVLALAIGGALLLLNRSSDTGTGNDTARVAAGDVAGTADIAKLLDGIPQKGAVLGFDEAPATLIEYGDLRCPSCRQWDTAIAPQVIEKLVRTKKAKLEFKLWPITRDSTGTTADAIKAAQGGLAAAAQDRFWSFALLFYANQQDESTSYATPAFLEGLARAGGVPDIARFAEDSQDAGLEAELQQNGVVAVAAGFRGTPSFMIQHGTDEPAPYKGSESDVDAIGAALAAP